MKKLIESIGDLKKAQYSFYSELENYLLSLENKPVPEPEPIPEPIPDPEPNPLNPFNVLMHIDFERNPIGPYRLEDWKRDWNNSSNPWSGLTRNSIVSFQGAKWMREEYPNGSWGGTSGSNFNGIIPNVNGVEEIYFSYDCYYDPNWFFGLGQKMPGIRSVPRSVAGGLRVKMDANQGFSHRIMNNRNGTMRFYTYHHNMPIDPNRPNWGHDLFAGNWGQVPRGKVFKIVHRLVMNRVGHTDGIAQTWIDGKLMASYDQVQYRTAQSSQNFNEIFYNTMMGGGDSSWATNRDQYMLSKDFRIWHYSDEFLSQNPNIKRGRLLWDQNDNLITP